MGKKIVHVIACFFMLAGAFCLGRSADYIIIAYDYAALHYIWFSLISSLLIFLAVAIKVGWVKKLIKKYRERNDIYLNLDDNTHL